MNAEVEIATSLKHHVDNGLELWLEGDALRFKAPQELMTPDLIQLLKSNKTQIRDWLKNKAENDDEISGPQIVDSYSLASTQGAIWMLYRMAPSSPAYNTAFVARLSDTIDEHAIKQALQGIVIRHPMLRSTFADTEKGPEQRVWNYLELPFEVIDAAELNEKELNRCLEMEADAPFDLQKQSCFRVKLYKNTCKGNVMVATVHHIGADLWALLLIAGEIKDYYQKAAKGEHLQVAPLSVQYRDHVEWQKQYLASDQGKVTREYWLRQMQSAPMTVSLPTDFERPILLAMKTQVKKFQSGKNTYQQIRSYCKKHRITPFVFVQTAFQLLVNTFSQQNDFLIGTPTMGRSQQGMDKVVGDFANPVVLRARISLNETIECLIERVQQTLLLAMEHQDYPYPNVVQGCNPPRDSSRTPLFQLMFVWHQGNPEKVLVDDFIKEVLPQSGPRGAPYDVMLAISDLNNLFEFNWTYQTALYESDTIERFNTTLNELIQRILEAEVDTSLGQIVKDLNLEHQQALVSSADNLLQKVKDWIPQLNNYDSELVIQTVGKQKLKRLFIAATDSDIIDVNPYLRQWFDDVVALPQLPRLDNGDVDIEALTNIAFYNQAKLQKQWAKSDLISTDWYLSRTQKYLPSFPKETVENQQHVKLRKNIDISARPDAIVKPEPLKLVGDEPETLDAALRKTAEKFGDKGLHFYEQGTLQSRLTYASLLKHSEQVAAEIQALKLKKETTILLQVPVCDEFFTLWWGVLLSGLKPLVVALPDQFNKHNSVAQKLYNVAHSIDELVIVTTPDRKHKTRQWLQSINVLATEDLAGNENCYQSLKINPEDTAFLQLTSGSTGTPKAIQITHKGILHHVAASAEYNRYRSSDRTLNWLPFDHVVPILTFHLKDVVLGIDQFQLTTQEILTNPLRWLDALTELNITHSWAPNFAYQRVVEALKQQREDKQWDFSSLKYLMNAGEQVMPDTITAFSRALANYQLGKDVVQPAFGMAEACTCMTYNNNSGELVSRNVVYGDNGSDIIDVVSAENSTHQFVDLGGVVSGVEIRITDSDNQVVKEGVIGRLQIRGPVVTPGYLNNDEANSEAFVGDNWFNSGDLGFIWQQRLVLTGREKEMIVVNGVNYYCFELEHAVSDLTEIMPTFVAATSVVTDNGEGIAIFYVPDTQFSGDLGKLEQSIIARITESFGVKPAYVISVDKNSFYKTTSGKIQRNQFRKQLQNGFYKQKIETFKSRNQLDRRSLSHGFRLDWLVEKHSKPFNSGDHVSVYELRKMNQSDGDDAKFVRYLNDEFQPHKIIHIGDFSASKVASYCDFYEFSQKLVLIARGLKVSNSKANAITLVVYSDKQSDLYPLKPLIETLRQETGQSNIGCVLTRKKYKHKNNDFAGYSNIGWYEEGLFKRLQLTNLYSASINLPLQNPTINDRGVYLITGGLGALAEELASYLVSEFKVQIILTSRKDLSQYPESLSRLARLKALLGDDHIHYLHLPEWEQKDVEQRINDGLRLLEAQNLDGVFHLAGELNMQSLEEADHDHWQHTLNAKVQGGIVLANYLQTHWPESIFVQYGSVNSFFGGQSAAAYSVANAIQAQLTAHLNYTSTIKAWCLHWSYWKNTGMAQGLSSAQWQMAENKGFLPLHPKSDAIQIKRLLSRNPDNYYMGIDPKHSDIKPQINPFVATTECITIEADVSQLENVPGNLQLQAYEQLSNSNSRVNHLKFNVNLSEEPLPRSNNGSLDPESIRALHKKKKLKHDRQKQPPANEHEVLIAAIWSEVLDTQVDHVKRTFFEYGGHSINATQVVALINQRLGGTLSVADLFQYPTVRELANTLSGETEGTQTKTLSLSVRDSINRAIEYRIDTLDEEQTNTSDPQIIFLPTASGIPSTYWYMANALKDYNRYAVSMPAISDQHYDLASQAKSIVEILVTKFGDLHRCLLVGWSYAGVLGFEILKAMEQRKLSLPSLIMLDSGFSRGLHDITFDKDFQLLMFAVELGLAVDCYGDFNQQDSIKAKLRWLSGYLKNQGTTLDESQLHRYWELYQKRMSSLLEYEEISLETKATIYQLVATHHTHGLENLGWVRNQKLLQWHRLPEDHQSIVKSEATATWIKNLIARLNIKGEQP